MTLSPQIHPFLLTNFPYMRTGGNFFALFIQLSLQRENSKRKSKFPLSYGPKPRGDFPTLTLTSTDLLNLETLRLFGRFSRLLLPQPVGRGSSACFSFHHCGTVFGAVGLGVLQAR